jgi:hypothetical protein
VKGLRKPRRTPMPRGEKLFGFLAGLTRRRFYGTATIRFQAGKVIYVETGTRRIWPYRELPDEVEFSHGEELWNQ